MRSALVQVQKVMVVSITVTALPESSTLSFQFAGETASTPGNLSCCQQVFAEFAGPVGSKLAMGGTGYRIFGNAPPFSSV